MDELQKKEAEKQEKNRIRKVIGGNLNLELERLGYTQYEAAKKCGLPRQTVNKLVNGGTVIDEVKIVALDGIGISIANLFKGLVREEPQPEESADGIINQYPSD